MAAWQWLADAVGAALLLLVAYVLVLVFRRRFIARHGGTFEVSVRTGRPEDGDPRGWLLGVARYRGNTLQWFRLFSPWPKPRYEWDRADLEVRGQRPPTRAETATLFEDNLVIDCETPRGAVELAMNAASFTGLSSWLEAGPPGTDWTQRPQR